MSDVCLCVSVYACECMLSYLPITIFVPGVAVSVPYRVFQLLLQVSDKLFLSLLGRLDGLDFGTQLFDAFYGIVDLAT